MAISFVQSATSGNLSASDTIAAVSLNGVGAGNLIVVWIAHELGSTTTYSVSDGTTTFTNGTEDVGIATCVGIFAYLLSANSGNKTYTCTFGTATTWRAIHVYEFASAAGVKKLDVQDGAAKGTNPTACASTAINTLGANEVVLCGFASTGGTAITALQIGGVNVAGTLNDGVIHASGYRLISGKTLSLITSTASVAGGAGINWIAPIIAFNAPTTSFQVNKIPPRAFAPRLAR